MHPPALSFRLAVAHWRTWVAVMAWPSQYGGCVSSVHGITFPYHLPPLVSTLEGSVAHDVSGHPPRGLL